MKALNGQNIIDLSVQQAGSAEAAYEAAKSNDMSLTDDIVPGTVIENLEVLNKNVMTYYSDREIKPATTDTRITEETNRILFEELSLEFF